MILINKQWFGLLPSSRSTGSFLSFVVGGKRSFGLLRVSHIIIIIVVVEETSFLFHHYFLQYVIIYLLGQLVIDEVE